MNHAPRLDSTFSPVGVSEEVLQSRVNLGNMLEILAGEEE